LYNVSELFKQYVTQPDREFHIKALVDGVEYLSTSVVEFEIEDSLIPSEDFTLGSVITSRLDISIRTADSIPTNAKIEPFVRMKCTTNPWSSLMAVWPFEREELFDSFWNEIIDDEYTEWVPLGAFYVDTRNYKNNVWKFTCYDKIILAQQDYVSALVFPTTMQAVWDEVCDQLGYVSDVSVVINPTYMIPYKPDKLFTLRDMLSFIASAHGASILMSKDEKVSFKKFLPGADKTSILASDYFKCDQINPLKTFTKLLVTYNTKGEFLTSGSGDADHTLSFYNPFVDQAMLDSLLSELNGLAYVPITMDWKGRPDLEVGDAVAITLRNGAIINSIFLTNKSKFKGGLKQTTTAPSYSPQRSETDYKGSIQLKIAEATENKVDLEEAYYGVTIGRTSGIVIEKSDGVSEATFNSDMINMKRSGVNIFDVNEDGWLELTGVIINGGTIVWGEAGANPPTPLDVGALPTDWVGTTYIDGTGLYTGTISANKINVGTLTGIDIEGVTITGSVISAMAALNVSSNIWESGGGMDYGINFGGVVSGYVAPCSIRYFQGTSGGDSALNIILPTGAQVYIDENMTVEKSVVIGVNLSIGGDLDVGDDLYVSGNLRLYHSLNYFADGCSMDTNGGDLRLKNSSGNYIAIAGDTLYFVKGGSWIVVA
jgi:hypothetical protein